jgi:hypothetical protein
MKRTRNTALRPFGLILPGSLEKPVWTLLSYVADWRWMLEGTHPLGRNRGCKKVSNSYIQAIPFLTGRARNQSLGSLLLHWHRHCSSQHHDDDGKRNANRRHGRPLQRSCLESKLTKAAMKGG